MISFTTNSRFTASTYLSAAQETARAEKNHFWCHFVWFSVAQHAHSTPVLFHRVIHIKSGHFAKADWFSYFNEHIDIDNVNYNEIWIKYFVLNKSHTCFFIKMNL